MLLCCEPTVSPDCRPRLLSDGPLSPYSSVPLTIEVWGGAGVSPTVNAVRGPSPDVSQCLLSPSYTVPSLNSQPGEGPD